MLKVKVNGSDSFDVNISSKDVQFNGTSISGNWVRTGEKKFHLISNDHSYNIEFGEVEDSGLLNVIINGVSHAVEVTNEMDALLQQLGMDKQASGKINTIKAPMPGLVLRLIVEEGAQVKKGDALLVLEAMKMENVIKAQGEGIVKKILVSIREAVDKNQVLMEME